MIKLVNFFLIFALIMTFIVSFAAKRQYETIIKQKDKQILHLKECKRH